jgi:hypothetical protein
MVGLGPLVTGSVRDQTLHGERPAFLSESIIREIMTGRYLTHVSIFGIGEGVERRNIHNKPADDGEFKHDEGEHFKSEFSTTYGPGRSCIVG